MQKRMSLQDLRRWIWTHSAALPTTRRTLRGIGMTGLRILSRILRNTSKMIMRNKRLKTRTLTVMNLLKDIFQTQ